MRQVLCALAFFLAIPTFAQATPVEVNYTIEGHAGDWILDFSLRNNLTPSGNAPVDFTLYKFGVSVPESSILGQPAAWTPIALSGYPVAWQFSLAPWFSDHPPPGNGPVVLFPQTTLEGFLIHSDAVDAPVSASWISVGSATPDNGRIGGAFSGGMYSGSPTRIATFLGSSTGTVIEAPQSPPPPQGAPVPEPSSLLFGLIAFAVGGLIAGRGMIR